MKDTGSSGPPTPSSTNRRRSLLPSDPSSRYRSLPSSSTPDLDPPTLHPYDYDYEANGTTLNEGNARGDEGRIERGEPTTRKGRLSESIANAWSTASRARGIRQKVLWASAILSLVYLFHSINSTTEDGHAWHPHLTTPPSSLSEDEPLPQQNIYEPPRPPTDPSSSSSSSSSEPPPQDLSSIDLSAFVQPRRKNRPSSPNPWSDSPSFTSLDLSYISPTRFGSSKSGFFGSIDPPSTPSYNSPPPTRYLLKAFEYAVKVMEKGWNDFGMGTKGTGWDRITGRVKKVEKESLEWIGRHGWELPLGGNYKVSEISKGKEMRRVQKEEIEREEEDGEKRVEEELERRDWVKRAFLHAWEGYKKHAWGHDELSPVTNLWSDNYNGWGATLVDNLDTLLIMNLSHEYNLARRHVSSIDFTYLVPSSSHFFQTTRLPPLSSLDVVPDPKVDYEAVLENEENVDMSEGDKWLTSRVKNSQSPFSPSTIPLFETTIRYLGGLISAYDLSDRDPLMLDRARELGDWLLPSLNTDWGLAIPRYKLGMNPDGGESGRAVLAEVGSLGMEFVRLSMITGDERYYIAAQRAMDTLETRFSKASSIASNGKIRGRLGTLLPSHVNPAQPGMIQGEYTFGGLADSYYEYLIKQAQLTRFTNPQFERMYEGAIESAYEHLIRPIETVPGREHDLITIGTMNWGSYRHELQHLTCFAGGMLGLGAQLMNRPRDLETAKNFTEACVWVYESSKTGIGGEQTLFYDKNETNRFIDVEGPDGTTIQQPRGDPMGVKTSNRKQIGRPETIESVFYMWRITGDRYWQDRGWQMFTSFVEHSITASGFATVGDVNSVPVRKDDSMESFVTAETLKYYYLLFSPRDFISLDDYVFNTEAHPFLIPQPKSSPRREPLWSGPEAELESEGFVEQTGEGTWVQKWARVIQASKLAKGFRDEAKKKSKGWFGGLVGKGKKGGKEKGFERIAVKEEKGGDEPVAVRKPIRPSEEELEQAKKGQGRDGGGGRGGYKGEAWMAQGGGGKGMGGGAPPPS